MEPSEAGQAIAGDRAGGNALAVDAARSNRVARAPRAWFCIALLVVVVAAGALRLAALTRGKFTHPDEIIATEVLRHLGSSRSLDTNWRHTNLPPAFASTDQYNFSGYYLALFGLTRLERAIVPGSWRAHGLLELRLNSALFSIASLAVLAAIALAVAGPVAALCAVLLAAVSPSLLMDGSYARPDALVILLSLVLLWVYLQRARSPRGWIAIAGLLVGFLVSIKISCLVYGVLLLPAVFRLEPRDSARGTKPALGDGPPAVDLRGALLAGVAVAVGFAIGAPGAVMNPRGYADGIHALLGQYSGDFPPNGLGTASTFFERMEFGLTWLRQTWGLAIVAVAVGAAHLFNTRRWDVIFGLLPFALTLGLFLSTQVFFERNLGPALAAFTVVAGVGIEASAAWIAARLRRGRHVAAISACAMAAAALAVPTTVSAIVLHVMFVPYDLAAELVRTGREFHRDVLVLGWSRPPWDAIPLRRTKCDPPLLEVHDAGDKATLAWLAEGKSKGWVEVRLHRSAFDRFVPSTFHTYLSSNIRWLMKTDEGPVDSQAAGRAADSRGRESDACGDIRWDWHQG